MKYLISEFLSLIRDLAPAVVPLFAVYLGWKLSSYSERRRRALEVLEKRFEAFRQLREVIDNIPRGLSGTELAERIRTEPELLKNLKYRLIRLFGLRRELIPHFDEKIVSFIDQRFFPLFRIETGNYELKPDAIETFADCCVELILETDSLETRLVELYRKRVK